MRELSRNKTKRAAIAVLAGSLMAFPLFAAGCGHEASFIFEASSGDRIKVTLDTSDGYELSAENDDTLAFVVSEDGETVLTGTFIDESGYSYYDDMTYDENVYLYDISTKDGNSYEHFETQTGDVEQYFLLWVEGSDTGVIITGNVGRHAAENAFNCLTLSLEN